MVALTWKDITFNYFGNFLSVNSKSNTFILYFRKKIVNVSTLSSDIFAEKMTCILSGNKASHLRNPGNQLLELVQSFTFIHSSVLHTKQLLNWSHFLSHRKHSTAQCNTVLEMDHLGATLLSFIYHTIYLKIFLTKIMENKTVLMLLLLKKVCVVVLILCDLMTFRGFQFPVSTCAVKFLCHFIFFKLRTFLMQKAENVIRCKQKVLEGWTQWSCWSWLGLQLTPGGP